MKASTENLDTLLSIRDRLTAEISEVEKPTILVQLVNALRATLRDITKEMDRLLAAEPTVDEAEDQVQRARAARAARRAG